MRVSCARPAPCEAFSIHTKCQAGSRVKPATSFGKVYSRLISPDRQTVPKSPRRASVTAHRTSASLESPHGQAAVAPGGVRQFDFLVLGSGIAGLTYATKVAQYGTVAIITKGAAAEGCTGYAQGGVCAVLSPLDSVEKHVHDTMVAGDYINSKEAVHAVCSEGTAAVLDLVRLGTNFSRTDTGELHLTREGGHSERRIVHAHDMTGAEIERALLEAARRNPAIHFFEHHFAVDLVQDEVIGVPHCLGVDVLEMTTMSMMRFIAPATMLATGGAGQVYRTTTNPGVSTGDGMAMAWRARAAVGNMEFVQFHPTAFADPGQVAGDGGQTFLISEAVRGEGGLLLNDSGERFMPRYHDKAELTSRDIVSRAILAEMTATGSNHVWLDISGKPAQQVKEHFPNIFQQCLRKGIDMTKEAIPVRPAQHYMCGGVVTGLQGETNLAGLYAVGEVAYTGLHGANRLASNSLLEGLVFGARAVQVSVAHAEYAYQFAGSQMHHAGGRAHCSGLRAPTVLTASQRDWVAAKRRELTGLMWDCAGIIRSKRELTRALQRVAVMAFEVQAMQEVYGVSPEMIELRNLTTVGELILTSALSRKESRGGHYCLDYPSPVASDKRATILRPWEREPAGPSRGAPAPSARFVINPSVKPKNPSVLKPSAKPKNPTSSKPPMSERPRTREVAARSQEEGTT